MSKKFTVITFWKQLILPLFAFFSIYVASAQLRVQPPSSDSFLELISGVTYFESDGATDTDDSQKEVTRGIAHYGATTSNEADVQLKRIEAAIADLTADYKSANYVGAASSLYAPAAGSGESILVISSSSNKFSQYPSEILIAEGLNGFSTTDISAVTTDLLSRYDVVIVGHMPLSDSQVTMLSNWTNAGGVMIAFRPDAKLAPIMGLTPAGGTLANQYLLVHTSSGPGKGVVNHTIQFQGTADLYQVSGATNLATLYSGANTATSYPAVTMNSVGDQGGTAVAFTYDLAKSVIYTRQGNPEWAGQKRDGQSGPIRSDDQFYPDWIDLSKVSIPQADEQQRLLANIITLHARKPVPRFWYLPRGLKAAVVMTGDDHANGGTKARFNQYIQMSSDNSAEAVADWRAIRGTSYIYPNTPITDIEARAFEQQGFEIALHLNTNCANYTPTSLESDLTNQLAEFKVRYPSLAAPTTNRTHCIAWSDWHTQPRLEGPKGIRLDANYYYWPSPWVQDRPGMFTGSGIPMRFADLDGGLIDVYQLTTQMTDESDQTFPFTMDQLLNKALGSEGYYGVFCANMHTDADVSEGSDAIIASAKSRNVPVISAKQLLTWLDGRNGSSFGSMSWNQGELSFAVSVASGARSLQGMLPITEVTGRLISLTVNGSNVPFKVEVIKGIEYAFFPASTGNYIAVYDIDAAPNQAPVVDITSPGPGEEFTAPASITITASASDVDGSVSLVEFFQGGTKIGEDTNGSDGWSLVWNDVTAGVYQITARALDNAGASTTSEAISVTVTAVCPCTVFQPSAAPTGSLQNDGQALQLGMKFRSSVDGFVTGVRFYKQSGNTGTHTGQLYSSSGTLLASVVFSNETSTGWQQASFASPVGVTAGTTYVISYHSSEGNYSANNNTFSQAIVNGPLTGLQNGVDGANGVYRYTSSPAFPASSYSASNYWVDAVFNTASTPGNQAPAVAITSPANDATFEAPTNITIAATATDADGTISKVEFFNSDTKLGEDTDGSDGWAFVWNSVPAGTYALTARATDNVGAAASSAVVNIIVTGAANAPPTVAIDSPVNNESYTAPAYISITASASDADGSVNKVEFFQGETKIGEDTNGSDGWGLTWDNVLAGAYQLTAKAHDNAGAITISEVINVKVDAVCPCTVFQPADAPGNSLYDDGQALQLGMKFRSSVDGYVTGVRFYKHSGNTGTHTGQLYSAAGALLASVTFSNETASGWQEQAFASPVAVTAGTTYVISYHSSEGNYSATNQYFNLAIDNGPLRGLANGEDGPNGLYAYVNTPSFPTENSGQAANYWVDVVFNSVTSPENQPPTIVLTSPETGAKFTEPASINLTATASDTDGSVSKVEFYQGDTKVGESLTSPYSYNWADVPVGTYKITAKAFDNLGLTTTSAEVEVTVVTSVNQVPVVAITSPKQNATFTAPANVVIDAEASDPDGSVAKVEFFSGDIKLGEDDTSPYSYTWAGVVAGTYQITARAIDNRNGTTTTEFITITVSEQVNQALVVAISSPADGANFTAPATLKIVATASDADGTVVKVEFFEGETLLGEDSTSPYEYEWSNVAAGNYQISAVATDDRSGVTTSEIISIVVSAPVNAQPVVALTSPANGDTFVAPASITLLADASDVDGSIQRVEFYQADTKLGEDTDGSDGFGYIWSNVSVGTYALMAKAFDNLGAEASSAIVNITVNESANTPPVVSLTAPTEGASYTAPASITMTATASDSDGTIALVEFFNGNNKVGESLTSPYSYTWAEVPVGIYSLTARSTDDKGAITISNVVNIAVNPPTNELPIVAITSPTDGATFTAPASISITASASDADGSVSAVEFFQGETKIGEDTNDSDGWSLSWDGVAAGTYQITARALDNAGASTTSAAVSVTVNAPANQLPAVALASPTDGDSFTAPASITLGATASDPDGTITKVEFFQNETKLGEDLTSPYTYNWSNVEAGTYQLSARATDNAGAISTSTVVSITVTALANHAPVVSNPIPDQNAVIGTSFSFTFTANTFFDPDNDLLTYTADLKDGNLLPSWLSFDGATRAFLGTPPSNSPSILNIRVTANDGRGGTVSDEFVLNISQPTVTGQQVTSFTLVNSHTEQDLLALEDGAVIVLSELSSTKLNIRANTSPSAVGSVKFELSGA
ncbi:Ig-like domain-containing protein, partial [Pontibacter virosus]